MSSVTPPRKSPTAPFGRRTRSRSVGAVALALLTSVVLVGCGGSTSSDTSGAAAGPMPAADTSFSAADQKASGLSPERDAAVAEEKAADGSVATVAGDQKLARQANISLTVKNVEAAAGSVRGIAAAARGIVLSESLQSDDQAQLMGAYSSITISVPADQLDSTLDQLAKLGTMVSRNIGTEDVTTQYVDTESRLKTMTASVERVRALMSQATKLSDIVALESELSQRQADLEALQTQLAALKNAVAMAPVEVRLSTDEDVLADYADDTGFMAGLKGGWSAFTTSVTVLVTALGALLPFLALLAVVLVPLVMWRRRQAANRAAPQPTARPAYAPAPAQQPAPAEDPAAREPVATEPPVTTNEPRN